MRNGNINTNGDGNGICRGNEVNDNVQRTTLRMVGDPVFWFTLDVIGGPGKTSERGEEQEDSIEGITYVIM
jgi:hypothetical protein